MSYTLVNNDFSSDNSPLTLSGAGMSRTGSALVYKVTVLGTTGIWQAAIRDRPGSRRGLKFQFQTNFARVTTPVGTGIDVIRFNDVRLYLDTTDKLVVADNASNTTNGATALSTTTHFIEGEIRHERDTGIWYRVWLDGTLEIDHRKDTGAAETEYTYVQGGDAVGKCTGEMNWLDLRVLIAQDPS